MAGKHLHGLLDCIRQLAGAPAAADQTDRQLLERFVRTRDEDAFTALVRRHGALVWGVCRRTLGHHQDAEEVFQATFLVLARKAGAVPWRQDVGNWLYGVACRVARKARGQAVRRRARWEPLGDDLPAPPDAVGPEELRPVLDEEVQRLPQKYRAPVVLCYLQGKTYHEAARLLGWAEGTVSGRLARARELLRRRLLRRGLTVPAALLAVLPSPGGGAEVVPGGLSEAVVRSVTAGVLDTPAAVLAKGVLRAMALSKWSLPGLMLLVLAGVGLAVAGFAQRSEPDKQDTSRPVPKTDPARRPPLKKEWVGRWQADPFAGTTALEITHQREGGGGQTYRLKDPRVVATLMKQLRIAAFENDIARGNIPPAFITFHKQGGRPYRVMLASDGTLQCMTGGEILVEEAFLTALNRRLSAQEGRPIDLRKFLPEPARPKQAPAIPPSLAAFRGGFKSLSVQYFRGPRLREARLTGRKELAQLEKALAVVKHDKEPGRKGKFSPRFVVIPKGPANQSWLYGHFIDREHLFIQEVGRLTVKPAFVKELNEQLSRLEGRPVDVLGDNQPPAEQVARERAFRELLSGARALRCTEESGKEVVVDRPKEVAHLVKALAWVEAPVRERKHERGNVVVEVTTARGKTVRLTWLRTGKDGTREGVAPLLGDLVEVSGLGTLWLDDQWKYRFRQIAALRELEAEGRRAGETTRLVSRDLPAFLQQVVNLVVHFREGNDRAMQCLTAEESRPILQAMKVDRVEKLSWTQERWNRELKKLHKGGAAELALTPGMGFSLPVVFVSDRELLIPLYGRVRLKAGIAAKVRRALASDPKKAGGIQLLPR
jgi:RNA polymerase sigma factor (sigma-70 family)